MGASGSRVRRSAPAIALLIVAVALVATIDDRHVGRAADERQMIWTAIAITETGQLGQARGRDFTFVRPDGEAVSRFGLGMSWVQLPAAFLAPAIERACGPASSQPLFLLAPLLLVLAAGACAGSAARALGGGTRAVVIAIVLSVVGSPLGSYAALGLSESLQAAALGAAYALALWSAASSSGNAVRLAVAAGVMASCAVLAKSALVVVAPAALLPLLTLSATSSRTSRVAGAALGFLPGAALWAYFEWARFGRLFGSYPGERFNHPFLDGLWRLTIGPNLGFVLFFPALVLVLVATGRRLMSRQWDGALPLAGAVAPFLILLGLAAPWWAWHGVWGWGPRLLIPAVPLLAACAAVTLAGWPHRVASGFVLLSILVNVPGLIQHPVPVTTYETNLAWPRVADDVARSFPGYARRLEPDGTYRISPDHVLVSVPQASQFVVFPWFFRANWGGDVTATARTFEHPPWQHVRPDLLPAQMPMTEAFVRMSTGYPRARFWGRGFWPSSQDAGYAAVYDEGVADQVIRLQQKREGAVALSLALKLVEIAPIRCNDGLVFESYRLLGERGAARAYLDRLSVERRACPTINVVLALFERDAGNETGARQFLGSVAERFDADAPLQRALTARLDAWPADLQSMIATPVKAAGE